MIYLYVYFRILWTNVLDLPREDFFQKGKLFNINMYLKKGEI